MENIKAEKPSGALWILPIVFGFLGGTIAAVIVGTKYGHGWLEFFLVGIVMSFIYFAMGLAIGMLLF